MTKIYSLPASKGNPSVNKKSVADFFNKRANKIKSIGPLHAVIYQDKNSELAEKRNLAEKEKLLPMLRLSGSERILDIGCGTGRWAYDLLPLCSWYHGIDACEGLIEYSKNKFKSIAHGRFSTGEADSFSLTTLNEALPFDRVLCAGVLIYLNDEDVIKALKCMKNVLSAEGYILFREPVGISQRLTLIEQYSDELEQDYNAIYRTRSELENMIFSVMQKTKYDLLGYGDVYDEAELNNRVDTKQQWLLLRKNSR